MKKWVRNVKLLLIVLALAVVFPITVFAQSTIADRFAVSRVYGGSFTDISESDWFYKYFVRAFEICLVNGTTPTTFSPNGKITVAQALTAASFTHHIYYDKTIRAVEAGEAWYAPYVNYCIDNGIITENQFADVNANITRSEVAILFGNLLPFDYTVTSHGTYSDITSDMACYETAKKFYQAGIVSTETFDAFRPADEITRAEFCAVLTSLIYPEYRTVADAIHPTGISIGISSTDLTMVVGSTYTLFATVEPSAATEKGYTWSSSNPGVASVNENGEVTASELGTAVITATTVDGGYTATCTITVVSGMGIFAVGDLNGDGKLSLIDVLMLLRQVLNS